MDDNSISVKNLNFSYDGAPVLKNLNFQYLKTIFAKLKAHIAQQCISAPFVRWTSTMGGKFNYELCQISRAAFWQGAEEVILF